VQISSQNKKNNIPTINTKPNQKKRNYVAVIKKISDGGTPKKISLTKKVYPEKKM